MSKRRLSAQLSSPRVRQVLLVGLALAVPIMAAGCHKKSRRSTVDPFPTALASSTEFFWSGDLRNYDALDEYVWNTVWDEVFIEFQAFDFFGEVRVQIYDDLFDEIFDETYFGGGGDLIINTTSELGFSGEWTVVITSFDVYGDVRLRLD